MQKSNSLSKRSLLAFVLCCCLVCGCLPLSFSANAATIAPNVSVGQWGGVGVHNGGWSFDATGTGDNVNSITLYQAVDVTGVDTINITWDTLAETSSMGFFQWGWWLASEAQWSSVWSYPYYIWYEPNPAYYTMRAGGNNLQSVSFDVSGLTGTYYLCVGAYGHLGGSYSLAIDNVVVSDNTEPEITIPDYSGGVGGSSNSIVTVQQGFTDQGVSIDTVVSQLGAEIINDEIFTYPEGHPLEGEMYEKISMRMGVLVSCTITNNNGQYAWLNDSYIGFQPSFSTAVPGLAEAASSYSLSDVYYSSPGFLVSSAQNGVIAFRFQDDTYYMGRLYLKPYATVSAAGILYFTCDVIAPYTNSAASIHLSESLSSTAMFGGNTLTGVNGVTGLLSNVPSSPSDVGGQVQIQGSVNNVQSAVNSMQQQQQQNFDEFMAAPDSDSIGNDVGGILESADNLFIVQVVTDLITRFGDFLDSDPTEPELTFPAFSLRVMGADYQLWDAYTFNFEHWGNNFPALVTAMRFATSGCLAYWLIKYINKLIHSIWGV